MACTHIWDRISPGNSLNFGKVVGVLATTFDEGLPFFKVT